MGATTSPFIFSFKLATVLILNFSTATLTSSINFSTPSKSLPEKIIANSVSEYFTQKYSGDKLVLKNSATLLTTKSAVFLLILSSICLIFIIFINDTIDIGYLSNVFLAEPYKYSYVSNPVTLSILDIFSNTLWFLYI